VGKAIKEMRNRKAIGDEVKKMQATKCSDHRTISLIAHTAEIIAKILRRRIERKIENVLGEEQFGFRRGKRTRDAIGMMRIVAE